MNEPMLVLVVEDDPVVAEMLCSLLTKEDPSRSLRTEGVSTLEKAIGRIEGGGIDAVLLDLGLPDASDTRALEVLRSRWPYLPIVVVTAQGADRQGEMLRAGACDYFTKVGMSTQALIHSLRTSWIRRRTMETFEDAHRSLERTGRVIGEMRAEIAACTGKSAAKLTPSLSGVLP